MAHRLVRGAYNSQSYLHSSVKNMRSRGRLRQTLIGVHLPSSNQQILLEAVWHDAEDAQKDLYNLIQGRRYLYVGTLKESDRMKKFQEESEPNGIGRH